jgi:RNA polymerase sigma-70 factor, ECF subfamily
MVLCAQTALEGVRRGDGDALAELWRTHQAPLLRYLRARGCQAPDDVASQVWIDVSASIHRFHGDTTDFPRWFYTIARRRSIDEMRRSARRDGLVARAAATVGPVDDDHAGVGALDRAIALISSLPANQADAVMLSVVHELPAADVAAIMGTTEGNVRVLVHRGLTRLRRKIGVTDATLATMNRT